MLLEKSNVDISCINNKSECISENDIQQYISREKKVHMEKLHTEVPMPEYVGYRGGGMMTSTFDNNEPRSTRYFERSQNYSRSRTPRAEFKEEKMSYKALMDLKGSKCTCVHSLYMQPALD